MSRLRVTITRPIGGIKADVANERNDCWSERFISEDVKNGFLWGLRAAAAMYGQHPLIDVIVEDRDGGVVQRET